MELRLKKKHLEYLLWILPEDFDDEKTKRLVIEISTEIQLELQRHELRKRKKVPRRTAESP